MNESKDHKKILDELEKKIYHPVYFLSGEEPFYIDLISDYIEDHVLTDEEKGFNQIIFYGKDTDEQTIMETALRFPMMANQQVIIVKEAQSLNTIEELRRYVEKPLHSTILVLNYKYKTLDKRTAFAKAIQKNGILFESPRMYENKIPGWIENYLADAQYTISPQASVLLAEYLGTDLGKIANELKKLTISLPPKTRITNEHIEKNIGISKDYNIFELQNALGERDILKANRIINYFADNPKSNPIQLTTVLLYLYFSKLFLYHFLKDKSEKSVAASLGIHPYFVKSYSKAAKRYNTHKLYDIIGILREYDMKSKGFETNNVSQGGLLKEMIYKILH
jgi:DNA polymerase III subunit delta